MMNHASAVIKTENLSKTYKSGRKQVRALDGLSLTVEPGEVFGYLGPNGAGKTTTIRLLLDLIRPTNGNATVLGMDAQSDSVALHKHIGFMPGELNLWKNLTGQQVINYVAKVRGGVDTGYVKQLAQRFELDTSIRVRAYSTGNKRKLGLVLALMNKPDLLILDEPTSGLDPLLQQKFYEIVREIREQGRTVFLSSHVLSEVQAICDRVGILRQGELKAVERVDDLTHANFRWVTVEVGNGGKVNTTAIEALPGVSDVSINAEGVLRLRLTGDFDPLMRAINDYYIADLRVNDPTLEEIFLAFYGGNGEAIAAAQA